MKRKLLWLTALTIALWPLAAQVDPKLIPRTRDERERLYRAEHHIALDVVVRDKTGVPVEGLGEKDFSLWDNRLPREIGAFQSIDGESARDTRVVLVIDGLNNVAKEVAEQARQVEDYIAASRPKLEYPTSIFAMWGLGGSLSDPSQNRDAVLAVLRTKERIALAHAEARVPEEQRMQTSLALLLWLTKQQRNWPGRVVVIWIGPGWPRDSMPEGRAETPGERKRHFSYAVMLTTELQLSHVTLDAVGTREVSSKAMLKGVRDAWQASAGQMMLPAVAYRSGGEVLTRKREIAAGIRRCIDDLRLYYVLSFDWRSSDKPDQYHQLEVKVDRPNVTTRAMDGYYSEP